MKRAYVVLVSITLVATALLPVIISTSIPRHVDPKSVPEEPLPGRDVALLYIEIFRHIGEFNITGAASLREVVGGIYIPENLRYIFSRFNELLDKIMDDINSTHSMVVRARDLMDRGMYLDAEYMLLNASKKIPQLKALYNTLVDAVGRIVRLGLPRELLDNVGAVGKAIDKLEVMIDELLNMLRHRVVTETRVTLYVWPREVVVGTTIYINGVLETVHGTPLENKTVYIHIGDMVYKVSTHGNGFFTLSWRVSVYLERVKIYAEYIPTGYDKYLYSYSRSSDVLVHIVFIKPKLIIKLNKSKVLPGETIRVNIITEPNFTVYLKSPSGKCTLQTDQLGRAWTTIKIPLNASEGIYSVHVETRPRGIYGPAKAEALFTVYKLEPYVKIHAPDIIFTGFTYKIRLLVEPRSKIMVLWFGGTRTYTGGEVEAYILLPHTYISIESIVKITIYPLDPRYKSTVITKKIVVYSTPSMILLAISLFSIGFYALRKARYLLALSTRPGPYPLTPSGGATVAERRQSMDPVARAFYTIVNTIASVYGVLLGGSDTLREYLRKLYGKLPQQLYILMKKLIEFMEIFLYGRQPMARRMASKIIELARRITRALKGGSS